MTASNAASPAPNSGVIDENQIRAAMQAADRVRAELARVYQGPRSTADLMLVCLLSRGHLLLEGVPGVAKTTLVKAFAATLQADFARVQFTPDLLPSDITGTYVYNARSSEFALRKGPVFANIVLGDEINRAPAKTQSALLEAMAEGQVTIEGHSLPLPKPFLVLATQNPIEQEGVYLLPEAQLDRFLIRIRMGYPSADQEASMLAAHGMGSPKVAPVLNLEAVEQLAELAMRVSVSSTTRRYIVALARATRDHPSTRLGASPRASLALQQAAKSRALLKGRDYVNVDDVRALVGAVFSHRIVLSSSAVISGEREEDIVRDVVGRVAYDPA